MSWTVLALVLVPIALFMAALVWYLNIAGIIKLVREKEARFFAAVRRGVRLALIIMVPVAIYGFLIRFFLGLFGWPAALTAALVLPILVFVPLFIWSAAVNGLGDAFRGGIIRRSSRGGPAVMVHR